jgi:phosphatidylglycerophosphate synthase
MAVSQRGYFTTRVLTRPVASLLLAAIPEKLEKYVSPNRISFSAFIVAQLSNLIFFIQLLNETLPFHESWLFWVTTQYLAYVLDCADGQFARQSGRTSPEGKILDMILDLAREVMRLLLFAYFLVEMKYGFFVVLYLALRT